MGCLIQMQKDLNTPRAIFEADFRISLDRAKAEEALASTTCQSFPSKDNKVQLQYTNLVAQRAEPSGGRPAFAMPIRS
jgi:hypothetical protein